MSAKNSTGGEVGGFEVIDWDQERRGIWYTLVEARPRIHETIRFHSVTRVYCEGGGGNT